MCEKISIMIDTDLWDIIRNKTCIPKEYISEDSDKINDILNNVLWEIYAPLEH